MIDFLNVFYRKLVSDVSTRQQPKIQSDVEIFLRADWSFHTQNNAQFFYSCVCMSRECNTLKYKFPFHPFFTSLMLQSTTRVFDMQIKFIFAIITIGSVHILSRFSHQEQRKKSEHKICSLSQKQQ